METVQEVLGPDNAEAFVTLSWAGRDEDASAIAHRLQPTLTLIAGLYPAGSVHWYIASSEIQRELAPVPSQEEALIKYVDSTFERPWGESNAWTAVFLELKGAPSQKAPVLSALSVRAGTADPKMNSVTLNLSPEFPMGTPSQAAAWFLELVRIWQPESAFFTTQATLDEVDLGITHAAYLAWISAARDGADVDGEMRIHDVSDTLYVAKLWTVPGIVSLHNTLLAGEDIGSDSTQSAAVAGPISTTRDLSRLDSVVRTRGHETT
ncbi:hypothetical protein [Arthrobacter citreus]|uniref:hypothetical protein n=1 Tax=Arthrobacter citreus TaxID=1670 RepID=UPI0036DD0312